MKSIRPALGAAALLLSAAALLTLSARSAPDATQKISAVNNGPSIAQMNDPKFQIGLLDKRVTDLETKLAAAQKQLAQYAGHTHSYHAPQCNEFVSVLNLRSAIDNPGAHAGMGACFIRASVGGTPPSQTSAPGK